MLFRSIITILITCVLYLFLSFCLCRFLYKLKDSVRNKAHLEGSITEAYIFIKYLTFCSIYLDDIKTRFNHEGCNPNRKWADIESTLSIFKVNVRPISRKKYKYMDIEEHKVHFYVLNNYEKIYHFIQ